jgi:hypothetical protein
MRLPTIISLVTVSLLSVASIAEQWMRGFFVLFMPYGFFTPLVILALNRPGFCRHLGAMENGLIGGVYEQQAVHG